MINLYLVFILIFAAHSSSSSSSSSSFANTIDEPVEAEEDFWKWLYGEDDGTDKTIEHQGIATSLKNIGKEIERHYGFFGSLFNKDEIDFHIFNVHDFDTNKRLDGLELLSMMAHQHEGRTHHTHQSPHGPSQQTDHSKAETLIDMILRTEDTNSDGFLDYSEFVNARRKHNDLKVLQNQNNL